MVTIPIQSKFTLLCHLFESEFLCQHIEKLIYLLKKMHSNLIFLEKKITQSFQNESLPHQAERLSMVAEKFPPRGPHFQIFHGTKGTSDKELDSSVRREKN